MSHALSSSERLGVQADRFGAALGRAGVADERARAYRERYLQARDLLGSYRSTVRQVYGELGVKVGKRLRLNALAQRLYGLGRQCKGEKLYQQLAVSVQDRLIEGSGWVEILAVVDAGMRALGLRFNLEEANELRRLVAAGSEEESMAKHRKAGAGAVASAVAVEQPGDAAKKERRQARRDAAGSVDNLVAGDVEWEQERKRLAMQNLKFALAGHHKIVKEVVARRLCQRKSFDELATMFEITREDVVTILERMRTWVQRFTAYFSDDWYWKEGGAKFVMPSH